MRPRTAFRRWKENQDPVAGEVLERRYRHVPDVGEALQEFRGDRLGDLADFARRRALGPPPEPPGPPLAVAILSRELAPRYEILPRLYVPPPVPAPSDPPEFVETPLTAGLGTTVRSLQNLCRDRKDVLDLIDRETVGKPGGQIGNQNNLSGVNQHTLKEEVELEERTAVDNINIRPDGERTSPTGTSSAQALRKLRTDAPELHAKVVAGEVSPHVERQPRAECRCLAYWMQGLAAVHRLASPSDARFRDDVIGLAVEEGLLRLFGRDMSRSRVHWADLPARTEGSAQVILARSDILARDWGRPGRLSVFDGFVRFDPDGGEAVWAPAVASTVPAPDETPATGGVLAHRLDVQNAIREAVGGDVTRAALVDEIRLILDDERRVLVVEAPGRGLVRVPIRYGTGDLDTRLNPRWLIDAVASAPADEVTVESLGKFGPLRIESGWLTCLLATRSETSLL